VGSTSSLGDGKGGPAVAARSSAQLAASPPSAFRKEHSLFRKLVGSLRLTKSVDSAARVQQLLTLCSALLSELGEVSGNSTASDLLTLYRSLDEQNKTTFFNRLATDFAPDANLVVALADAYRGDPSAVNLNRLQHALESSRQELFRRISVAPEGMLSLLQLRSDLRLELDAHPMWSAIDADLFHLFRAWFNRPFLELRQIDWRTSAIVLEKLIEHEAVHQIQGWRDLRRRLQADRRCYGFFHRALPDEPIIFIEVALASRMGCTVQPSAQNLCDALANSRVPAMAR